MYIDSDMCVLPISKLLETAVLIKTLGTIGKRQVATDRYRGEFNELLAESMKKNPDFPRDPASRGVTNNIFGKTDNIFAKRSGGTQDDLRYIFRRSAE
jgi:hypothetical protein